MDLRRLEVFVAVAELGSFSRAAETLHLSQPTVSEHVRALEEELGLVLLDRLARGTVATRAGDLVLGYARRLLALAAEARQAVHRFQGRMAGRLVVGGSTIPGEYVLPAVIGAFTTKYPEVAITLRIGDSLQVSGWVEDGTVEIAVVGARPAARALESRALMQDELVCVMAPDHPWARRAAVSAHELAQAPLIVRERGSGSRDVLEGALERAGLDLGAHRIVAEIASTQAIKQAVRAGVGVSLVSRRAVDDECRAGLLACAPVNGLALARAFHLVVHRERTRSPLAEAFVALVESAGEGAASQAP
jgi:DNA-binding transcriptional LysR family regulator